MRFLLDQNMSPQLAGLLGAAGHDAVHVRSLGLASEPDDVVLAAAEDQDRVIVSADTDFGTLLARSGAHRPSVVLVRRAVGRRAADQARLLTENLPTVESDLVAGAVVVLGGVTLRVRSLPIGR